MKKWAYKNIYWRFKNFNRKISEVPLSKSELDLYWKSPDDGYNIPEEYYKGFERSELLTKIALKYIKQKESKILELGCNLGRNLNYLSKGGFNNLTGIEINQTAVNDMKIHFPNVYSNCNIIVGDIFKEIKEFKDNEFECIYSMAVLQHLPSDEILFYDDVFKEMVRCTKKYIITIEDEKSFGKRHFPRNYKKVFERLGMKQIYYEDWSDVISPFIKLRIFQKNTKQSSDKKGVRKSVELPTREGCLNTLTSQDSKKPSDKKGAN